MASNYIPRKKAYNRYGVLSTQRHMLEKHFPFLNCEIVKNVLVATGWLDLPDSRLRYKVRLEYVAGKEPKSTIFWPVIAPSVKIHMYSDHSLCLHYAPDMWWTERTPVYQYTVPWIAEWIVYYELYEGNGGIWEGPESPFHIRESDKNTNIEYE